jgi:hypothetical protein
MIYLGSNAGGLPGIMHHPDALPQRDARRWPARHGCPVGHFRHLEVVHASERDKKASP